VIAVARVADLVLAGLMLASANPPATSARPVPVGGSPIAVAAALVVDLLLAAGSGGDLDPGPELELLVLLASVGAAVELAGAVRSWRSTAGARAGRREELQELGLLGEGGGRLSTTRSERWSRSWCSGARRRRRPGAAAGRRRSRRRRWRPRRHDLGERGRGALEPHRGPSSAGLAAHRPGGAPAPANRTGWPSAWPHVLARPAAIAASRCARHFASSPAHRAAAPAAATSNRGWSPIAAAPRCRPPRPSSPRWRCGAGARSR
jgi:hypothetical protein